MKIQKIKALGLRDFFRRLFTLARQPTFIFITIWGHLCIFLGTAVFHWFEAGSNPKVDNWLDTFVWGINVVTTVGASQIYPMTTGGKVVAVVMMIGGSLFLWSYAGLVAGVLISPDIREVESGLKEIEEDVHQIQVGTAVDERILVKLIQRVDQLISVTEEKNKK